MGRKNPPNMAASMGRSQMIKIEDNWLAGFVRSTIHSSYGNFTHVVKTADGQLCTGLGKHHGQFKNATAAKNSIRYSLHGHVHWLAQRQGGFQDNTELKSAVNSTTGQLLEQILDQELLIIEEIPEE